MDTSIHDWLEGRGESMVLIVMIDDATNRIQAGFYPGETVESHLDLLGRWLKKQGRPLALYTDRDSIFVPPSRGDDAPQGPTQFGRALAELGMERSTAYSPQAKGRVERFFQLAQDRWVKEMRLAGVTTRAQANRLLRQRLVPEFNRRFTLAAARARNAHRDLGREHALAAILSVQTVRTVDNDYTIRFHNRCFQIDRPIYPGLRRGKVIVEERLHGKLAIRYGEQYLRWHEIPPRQSGSARHPGLGGSAPQTPRSLALSRPTPVGKNKDRALSQTRSSGVPPTVRRSGRTPAEPYPPNGTGKVNQKPRYRPPEDHPWRTLLLRPK
jgi:hypothetical protein